MEYKQVSDFRATGAVTSSDLIYSYNVTSALEQKTTVQQLMNFLMANFASNRQTLSVVTDGQAVYTGLSYIPNLVNLWIAGIRLSPTMYTATDGQTITITSAGILARLKAGQTIDMDVIVSVTSSNMVSSVISQLAAQRQSIPVTSNGQAAFVTGGYTVGLINVFVAGARLSPTMYQATDGVTLTILSAKILAKLVTGMTVDIEASVSTASSNMATLSQVQAMDPINQVAIGTLTGAELISTRQGAGLFQSTLTKIAQWILQAYQGFTQTGTGATARTVQAKLQDTVSVKDFGATGDGSTDDTVAIQAAINAASIVVFPAGIYLYSTLSITGATRLVGAGKYETILKTSNLTGNTLTFSAQGWGIRDIGFDATANRTGGAHVYSPARYAAIENCSFTKFYIGIDLDGCAGVDLCNLNALNGTPSSVSAGGAIIRLGYTTYTGGINIRGLIADVDTAALQPSNGIVLGYVDVVTIDSALIIHHGIDLNIAPQNGQFAALVEITNSHFDTAGGGLLIRPATGAFVTRVNCANTWFGEHTGHGAELDGTNGAVTGISFTNCMWFANSLVGLNTHGANLSGVYATNCFAAANTGNGLQITGGAQNVVWDGGVLGATHALAGNGSYGAGADASGVTGTIRNANLESNTTGRISDPGNLLLTAGNTPYSWTSYTPTVTAQAGTITTAAATGFYKKVNKTVHFRLQVTITANGTGATSVQGTLPFPALGNDVFMGRDQGVTGHVLQGVTTPGSSTMTIWFYDGSYPGANGAQLLITGTYECQ